MSYQIRKADVPDIPIIQGLARAIWPLAYGEMISKEQLDHMLDRMYSTPSLLKQMEEGHRFLLIQHEKDQDMGYASYRPLTEQRWKLEKLYVRTDRHRKGLGRLLLQAVIHSVREQKGSHLELQVNRKNPAVGFYHRMGFEIIRDEDFDIGHGFYMNDHIMELAIG